MGVISHEYYSDVYYKLLITPDAISGPFSQKIGSEIGANDIAGETAFSPDGSKFCFSNHGGWFDYMQFDRCTGEFSNSITLESLDSLSILGNSFSPNGRFLYISSSYNYTSMIFRIQTL